MSKKYSVINNLEANSRLSGFQGIPGMIMWGSGKVA